MTRISVLPVATNIYIFPFWNSSRVKSDLFTLSDLHMERIGLKHYIWSDTTKEGSVFRNLTWRATFLVAGAEWEFQVIKTISCNKSKMLPNFLQKNYTYRLYWCYGNQQQYYSLKKKSNKRVSDEQEIIKLWSQYGIY